MTKWHVSLQYKVGSINENQCNGLYQKDKISLDSVTHKNHLTKPQNHYAEEFWSSDRLANSLRPQYKEVIKL